MMETTVLQRELSGFDTSKLSVINVIVFYLFTLTAVIKHISSILFTKMRLKYIAKTSIL